jgi:hypothetical protein
VGDDRARGIDAAMVLDGVVIDLGGLPVGLRATEDRPAQALAGFLRAAGTVALDPVLEVTAGADPLRLPSSDPSDTSSGLRFWRRGGELVVAHSSGVAARATTGRVEIGGTGPSPQWDAGFRRVLTLGLARAAIDHGRLVVHAGAVAVDGRAVLLVGGSGAGKSTTSWAAHGRGAAVLADDLVFASLDDGVPLVAGVPRPITVAADLDSSATGVPLARDARGRVELGPDALTPGVHPVGGSMLLASAPEVQPPSAPAPRAVLRSLLAASFGLAEPDAARLALRWGAAVARLPAVRVVHGESVGTRTAATTAAESFASVVEAVAGGAGERGR